MKTSRLIPYWIFAGAAIFRFVALYQSRENPFLYSVTLDEAYYLSLARAIASGFWLGEPRVFFMDPLFGYFLAGIVALIGDDPLKLRMVVSLFDAINASLIFIVATKAGINRGVSIIASVLYAISPVAIFYSMLLLKASLTVTGLLLFTVALLASRDRGAFYWVWLGLLTGVLVYLRANLLLLAPLAIIWFWGVEKPDIKKLAAISVSLLIGLALALLPGTWRNHKVSGEFLILNSQGGRLLYASNNPENLTGRYNVPSFSRANPVSSETDFHREAERRLGKVLSAKESSTFWTKETIKFAFGNPSAILQLTYAKLKWFVANFEVSNNFSFETFKQFSGFLTLKFPNFAFALSLGIPGLILLAHRRKERLALLIPVIVVLTTILLFYASSRFRFPLIPFLYIGAASFLYFIVEALKDWRPQFIMALAAIAAIIFTISMSVDPVKKTGTEEYLLAKSYLHIKEYSQTDNLMIKATEEFGNQARFEVIRGIVALNQQDFDAAISFNNKALELEPGNSDATGNLGLSYLGTGENNRAKGLLQKAVTVNQEPKLYIALGIVDEKLGNKDRALKMYLTAASMAKPGSADRNDASRKYHLLLNRDSR